MKHIFDRLGVNAWRLFSTKLEELHRLCNTDNTAFPKFQTFESWCSNLRAHNKCWSFIFLLPVFETELRLIPGNGSDFVEAIRLYSEALTLGKLSFLIIIVTGDVICFSSAMGIYNRRLCEHWKTIHFVKESLA